MPTLTRAQGRALGILPKPAKLSPLQKLERGKLEQRFIDLWNRAGGPPFEREYRFDSERRWRFDFSWPRMDRFRCPPVAIGGGIAVEIEGGTVEGEHRGRHMRAEGFKKDAVKYAEAFLAGWSVVRLTADMITAEWVGRIAAAVREGMEA